MFIIQVDGIKYFKTNKEQDWTLIGLKITDEQVKKMGPALKLARVPPSVGAKVIILQCPEGADCLSISVVK